MQHAKAKRPPLLGMRTEVLAHMWPAERAVMGMRVCKHLRQQLSFCRVRLVHTSQKVDKQQITKDLHRLRCAHLAIEWSGSSIRELLLCISCSGCAPALRGFHLRSDVDETLAQDIAATLKTCKNLNHLKLTCKSSEAMTGLIHCVRVSSSHALTSLHLDGTVIGTEGAHILANVLKHRPALVRFSLVGNDVGDEGVGALSQALVRFGALRDLDLRSNLLGPDGVEMLSSVLIECKGLSSLNLACNEIGPDGVKRLVRVLPKCKALTSLDLGCNEIGAEGAGRLAAILSKCKALTHLSLVFNRIGEEGARKVAAALGKSRRLKSLNLGYNAVGSGGAVAVASSAWQCQTLADLSLCGNGVHDGGAVKMAAALWRSGCVLGRLRLSANSLSLETGRAAGRLWDVFPGRVFFW